MDRMPEVPGEAGRKQRYLRELGLPILFGAVVLLGSATLLLLANISALRGNLASVEHAQNMVVQIAAVQAGIIGDEMTVRGYALTGDPLFLGYQANERAKTVQAEKELLKLAEDEPENAAEFARLKRLIDQHMRNYATLTRHGSQTAAVVAKAIVDPAIRANMAESRLMLAGIRNRQLQSLYNRQRQMTDQITQAFLLASGIIVAAFVLGCIGIWAARWQFPSRKNSKF